jgi:alpha-tubulin suppressor-like RCC1 family protein
MHTLACSDEGVTYSFGLGGEGQLGHGGTIRQQGPRVVEALQGVHILAVAAGGCHSLALSEAGELYSFGDGSRGSLGHGDKARQCTPRLIAALQGVHVSAVVAGLGHSLALTKAGVAYSFGFSRQCQLGHSSATATRPTSPRLNPSLHCRACAWALWPRDGSTPLW